METAALRLLSAGSLHFQQAEPKAGKGRRVLHHAGTGGCPDERHDAEVIHVFGNDRAAVFGFGGNTDKRTRKSSRKLQKPGQDCDGYAGMQDSGLLREHGKACSAADCRA